MDRIVSSEPDSTRIEILTGLTIGYFSVNHRPRV
jgi:hypothetical protein